MPIELDRLVKNLNPEQTVLFFGAGSSISSGSPTTAELTKALRDHYSINDETLGLSEVAELAELETDRADLITFVRSQFSKPEPTGGLLNIPRYPWRGIYTTNYDELIEKAYTRRGVKYHRVTTNFDFSTPRTPTAQPIYKIHGTLSQDVSDGSKGRMILTLGDYDKALDYREFIYNRLASDMAGANVLIVGFSLSDPDIKSVVERIIAIQAKMGGMGGHVYLLLYQKDDSRARLFEARGIRVAFGGLDELSEALARQGPSAQEVATLSADPVKDSKLLSITTIDVKHSKGALRANASAMFNGWPATYADVAAELTFQRTIANTTIGILESKTNQFVTVLGASGVGKTTAVRQVVSAMDDRGWQCWEHKPDFEFYHTEWLVVARWLQGSGANGLLVIDEAHFHLLGINRLVDGLLQEKLTNLSVIVISSRSQWQYRTKSVGLTRLGKEIVLAKLNSQEVDRLIFLASGDNKIAPLVESTFAGFSFHEKRSRLLNRCEADAFVCLRNIFATDKFDDIILREYASLPVEDQEIYRLVAAMEHAGIRVHRQLVIRLSGIAAEKTAAILSNLVDIISEYDVSERFGVYGWKVRHAVIASIIAKYKFADQADMLALFERVIDNISPAYDIELRTIREICNVDTGLPSIPDKAVQNRLLRKLISMAPGESVPRHRLIRNLISMDKFDLAETEIRVFENELGADAPVSRYRISLLLARALNTPGIMKEDRIVILRQAESKAAIYAGRYTNNPRVLSAYGDVGLELLKYTGEEGAIESALKALKDAETRTGDEEITKLIRTYERRRYEVRLS